MASVTVALAIAALTVFELTLAVTVPFERPDVAMLYSGIGVCTVQPLGMPEMSVIQSTPLAFTKVPVSATP